MKYIDIIIYSHYSHLSPPHNFSIRSTPPQWWLVRVREGMPGNWEELTKTQCFHWSNCSQTAWEQLGIVGTIKKLSSLLAGEMPDDFRIISGRIYNRRKQSLGGQTPKGVPQIEAPVPTSSIVASELGVSKATIERNGQRAEVYGEPSC